MVSVGIDLGTTNSLVAVYEAEGPRIIKNAIGEMLTPSVVGLADDMKTVLIGRAAQQRLVRHPEQTKALFKRMMGTNTEVKLGRKRYTAVDLSAMVLSNLKADAEADLGHTVTDAVISVPAYFNAVQRQATKDAAEIAGLNVRRLINEPTAAALANGILDRDGESTFVVLDLGGGTFDVSILEMFDGVMEVRASSGDAFLGGEDFTEALARHFCEEKGLLWKNLRANEKEMLLSTAEQLKRALERSEEATAQIELSGQTNSFTVTGDLFDQVTAHLLTRLNRPIEKSLYDADISPGDVDRVILVGGATRMSCIRSLAAKVFKKLPERTIDPDHAIALGAAVQAGLADKHEDLNDIVMTDVAPFSMGIESNHWEGKTVVAGAFAPIIERNTILPASRRQFFSTAMDQQTKIEVRVFQGESAIAQDNVPLGMLMVPVPPGPKGKEAIEVRFTYDVSGLLAVDVKVLSIGKTVSTVIDNLAEAMSDSEKAKRLKAMEALKVNARDDAANIALIEGIKHLHEMLLGEDRQALMSILARFETALETQDPSVIERERKEISDLIVQIEARFVQH
ncbi:Hsp70 family protein [Roseovarius rhodophyticola]|uniref:Hsp70 family protein n=1 Tax=Roseovarius rhodophyticola TaxID=3080827 RepID=A0ABZ2TLQ0_9RHOB|nr:Hsp70 family protein [Roseovarius sp. W115]MDV2929331.1 Hsp70 family protein [Roseovarius sp. W115]